MASLPPVQAAEMATRTDYAIAIAGLPVASASFQTTRSDKAYAIRAQITSTGIANLISDTKAEITSEGAVRKGLLRPDRFQFRYAYGKRKRVFDTRFANGNVISSIIEPQPSAKQRRNWVPVRPEHLLAVADPVAGLIRPAGASPCEGRIAVYDGEARLDLVLAPRGERSFRADGYAGGAVACNLRYEPKSGYRRGHRDLEYVRKLKTMEIWFAKSGPMNVYAPVFLSVPTKYGTLTITATHFEG
jgi:hypothetical protein